jgi:hypothetical protein
MEIRSRRASTGSMAMASPRVWRAHDFMRYAPTACAAISARMQPCGTELSKFSGCVV